MGVVHELFRYPIKSFPGLRCASLDFDQMGPTLDRAWMLIDAAGKMITQRQRPELSQIKLSLGAQGIALTPPGGESVRFAFDESEGEIIETYVFSHPARAREVRGDVSQAMSEYLGAPVRLVRWEASPTRGVRLSDGEPVLVVSTASLADLEGRAGVELDVLRFRPNVVVSGVEAYAEDAWPAGFKIGDLVFESRRACSRCSITTVEPTTGVRGPEPLQTLATYRRSGRGVTFGFYYAPVGRGRVQVGDALEIFT